MAAICGRDTNNVSGPPLFWGASNVQLKGEVSRYPQRCPCPRIRFEPRFAAYFVPHSSFYSTLHLPLHLFRFLISVSDAVMVDSLKVAFFVWTGSFLPRR